MVNHAQGHARVVAVAGAGKTTTLTHFIRARLEQKVSPRRLLVLMYNKAAQQDFQRKLKQLLPKQALPEIRTFHSLGWRIYQRLIADGELPAFGDRLLSDGEMDTQVWRILQQSASDEVRQDILSQRKKWVEPALAFIDRVKSGLETPEQVFDASDLPSDCRVFIDVFDAFEEWRKQQRRISYADMIYDPARCFQQHPGVAARFAGHMEWILVDEYQDINAIQQSLLDVIYGGRGSVMVIGDPDQTIYEFRGSRPEYILTEFDQRFGQHPSQPVTHYQLPHTFRYGHALSLLANCLIQHNQNRDPVLCLSHSSTPKTQVSVHCASASEEAERVLTVIKQSSVDTPLEGIAVINRLWALCAPIELALLQAGIPYQLNHSRSVLERYELQIFWLLLEVAAGEFHLRSRQQRRDGWLMLLTTPFPKIKRDVLEQLADQLSSNTEHLGVALQHAIPSHLSRWQQRQLEARAHILDSAEYHGRLPVQRLLNAYIDQTELEQGIEDSAFSRQQVEDRLQTIRAFVRFMADTRLPAEEALGYLRSLQAARRAMLADQSAGQGVHLTSIHKSKGLEWHTVIIPGLNGHYYPYRPEGEFASPPSEESERRLLYVAMTRARHQLHIMTPPPWTQPSTTVNSADTPADREQPSPFEQQLAFHSVEQVAKAIDQQGDKAVLDRQPPDWLPQYLSRIGQSIELRYESPAVSQASSHQSGRKTNRRPMTDNVGKKRRKTRLRKAAVAHTAQDPSYTEPQRHVRHQTLGAGRLLGDEGRFWVIQFDADKQPRRLDKQISKAYLTWLD